MAALALVGLPQMAAAQVYRCSSSSGTYISDKPCGGVPSGKLGMVGPTDRRQDYNVGSSSITPSVGKAPDHLAYLSPECAQLNDAIRTAPARGLKYDVINDLRNEYRRKCSEDERNAYQQLAQQQRGERDARQSQIAAQQQQANESARNREQCGELLRILTAKRRQEATMTPGEKADLQRFQANYEQRCKG
ncbi:hypothetical protein DZC73_10795 [Albitalea terrae]|uniref:DUF4124 domain-containing protein n=2 Tax=Piscinibacter terrae TaxID=2496871 RepID=A0A3N7HSN4_9BURK|nr:hypothetical protein DZC73_10795 [Albitalea terrae]